MNVEEAHKVLGLYVGASREQIELKFAELSQRLSTDEKAELKQLETARRVALGEDTATPAVPLWRRGPFVVLMIFVALGLVTGAFFVAAKSLDKTQAGRAASAKADQARAVQAAWEGYRKGTGASSAQGQRGDDHFRAAEAFLSQEDYPAAVQAYDDAVTSWLAAFSEEDKRISHAWTTQVLDFWEQRLKGRFPFKPESEQEAEAADVARLFNPASGAIWSVAQEWQALNEVEVQDRRVATPLKDFDKLRERAAPIRDALFGKNSPTIDVRFEMRLKSPPMLSIYRLQAGGAEAVSRGDEFVSAHWRQAEGGARLIRGVDRGEKADVLVDLSTSDWGLLRMLSRGDFLGEQDGVFAWEFEPEQFGSRRGKGAAIQVRPLAQNPFDPELFSNFDQ